MKLSTVLSKLDAGSAEKTAAAAPAPSAPSPASTPANERLKQALNDAIGSPAANDKTAAAPVTPAASPVADMTKIAADLAAAEHEALVKEANLYGAAVADGMVARLAQYGLTADKIASAAPSPAPVPAGDDFAKFASENPDLVREAAELGFNNTVAHIEKLSEAAYVKAYNETVEGLYKVAHHCFTTGFKETLAMIGGAR